MFRHLLILFVAALPIYLSGQNPYETLKYDSLVIYDFEWRGREGKYRSILDINGNLPPTIKKSVTLSFEEANELSKKIGDTESYGQITAACFDPHFGMVYYEDGKAKEHITICLSCNFPRTSLELPARKQWPVGEGDDLYYSNTGFSRSFRNYLSTLKKKYGFDHAGLNSAMFDLD